jgi:hypothetical protein
MMRLSTALVINYLLVGVAAASGAAGAIALVEPGEGSGSQAPIRQPVERSQPAGFSGPCKYLALTYGPAIELSASSQVTLTRNETLLSIDDEDSHTVYDLLKSPPEPLNVEAGDVPQATRPDPGGKPELMFVSNSPGTAQSASAYGQGVQLRSANQIRVLNSGRVLSISRLYGNVFFLKVGPSNRTQYDQLARDLLNGSYCGVPIEQLSPVQKQAIEPIVKFFLWNSLSAGIMDNYDPWIRYEKIAKLFFGKEELDDFLEDYAYRASEIARADPILAKVDPDKVWSFAWNAVAGLFHDKDYVKFADLSTYQRDGRIAFMLLGVEPIIGGRRNKFGFYTKPLTEIKTASFHARRAFAWNWNQDHVRYTASVALRALQNKSFSRQSAFPADEKNGLIVLDATFSQQDVSDVVDEYMNALRNEGFIFTRQREVADLPRYIGRRFLAAPRIDYLVREGHADGDDDNVMTVYEKGFVVDGRKTHDAVEETISILFGDSTNSKERRIPEYQFAAWVNDWHRQSRKPFVYLNTSCWGNEKAWVDLGYLSVARLIEIASVTPVNYFSASGADAVHIILDGLRHADSFHVVRSKLTAIGSYSSGYEDRFIFPDQDAYPTPFALFHRALFVAKRGEKIRKYVPDGYF